MSREIELRPYQAESVEQLRNGIRNGHRAQMLVAPTGAGKTMIATSMIRDANRKGTDTYFIVDRVQLVNQTSAMLDRYGIDHGVRQADHWRFRPYLKVQVCSAQTLERTRGFNPDGGLIFVDEAHSTRAFTSKLIKETTAKVIGLTATPFTKGLAELYSNVVNVTTTNKLIEQQFLTPVKAYACVEPDMDGARIVAGEYADKEIEERGSKIVGDIVAEWTQKTSEHFGGPVKTIVFSATVAHGDEICRAFQKAGHNFAQISFLTEETERAAILAEFSKPDSRYIGLVSVDALAKGFDQIDILCGIDARPLRKSFSTFVQMLGRVMRIAPGTIKERFGYALWLDHSGNFLRFQSDLADLFENGVQELDDGKRDATVRKKPDEKEKQELVCSCGAILPPAAKVCPACGKERVKRSMIETVAGKMVEIGQNVNAKTGKKLAPWMADREGVWGMLVARTNEEARRYGRQENDEAARKKRLAKWWAWYGEAPPKGLGWNNCEEVMPSAAFAGRWQRDNIARAKALGK